MDVSFHLKCIPDPDRVPILRYTFTECQKMLTQKVLNVNRTFDRDQSVRSLSKRPSSILLDSLLRCTFVKCTARLASGNQHRKGVTGPVDF